MQKTILITGSTDGIGLLTAKMLAADGHRILLHGRNPEKLKKTEMEVGGETESYVADLSRISDVEALATAVVGKHNSLDVLINNAGIFKTPTPVTPEGLDVRFVVNTLAPYKLIRILLPLMNGEGRVINLSSAAQAPVNLKVLRGETRVSDMDAYAQSKLALTMWSFEMAKELKDGPMVLAVNPGSMLASKMVKEGFGVAGNDLSIGADLLCRAALSDEFANASGKYFDNDQGRFSNPDCDALNPAKSSAVVQTIEDILTTLTE